MPDQVTPSFCVPKDPAIGGRCRPPRLPQIGSSPPRIGFGKEADQGDVRPGLTCRGEARTWDLLDAACVGDIYVGWHHAGHEFGAIHSKREAVGVQADRSYKLNQLIVNSGVDRRPLVEDVLDITV